MADASPALIRNQTAFVAFARKRLGDPALAEDVVQDSLLKALKAARPPTKDDELVTWFYRILRRSIIDLYRRRDVRRRTLEQFQQEFESTPTTADERTLCQCFRRLLPDLPPSTRDALERVDLEGQPAAEAAAALGLTVNNLYVRLHRARSRMRLELQRICGTCSKHGCLNCTCAATHAQRAPAARLPHKG